MSRTVEEIRAEVEAQERKHDELMATLDIPAEVEWEGHTFTNRRQEAQWVKRTEKSGTYYAITGTSGWTAGCSEEVFNLLKEGDPFVLENYGFNRVAGWCIDGKWYDHKSDQQIEAEDTANREKTRSEFTAMVEKNRAEWEKQEEGLPDWAKALMEKNREGSEDFDHEYMGWGYTLAAVRLAVLYAEQGDVVKNAEEMTKYEDEPEHIKDFHSNNGISGNQAGWAFWAAHHHLNGKL